MAREHDHQPVHDQSPVTDAHYDEGYDLEEVEVVDRPVHWYDFDLAGRVNSVLFTVLFAIEALLLTRFLLVLFGANRSSGKSFVWRDGTRR